MTPPQESDKLRTTQIQGIILSGYNCLGSSAYLFLHFTSCQNGKSWLKEIANEITFSHREKGPDGKTLRPHKAVNIAFTCSGLKALNLSQQTLDTFAQEFFEGMGEKNRARRLGDEGASAPQHWDIGNPGSPPEIHALLMLFAPDVAARKSMELQETERLERFHLSEVPPRQAGERPPDRREHFGFRDGISQPAIEGHPRPHASRHSKISAGEFILGYRNGYKNLPPTPTVAAKDDPLNCLPSLPGANDLRDFGSNGSYLVFRKLKQDVAAFRNYFQTYSPAGEAELMAAKCVGRWPNGNPLLVSPIEPGIESANPPNDFGYAELDSLGFRCPTGAHIRRTNPRDSLGSDGPESNTIVNRHRLIRRGVRYGPALPEGSLHDDGEDRGLLFICINADIERQFEFIQQTWANNPKFGGLYNDRDPLLGSSPSNLTIPRDPIRFQFTDLPRFVTVKGGGYFFLPSKGALDFMAR